MKIREVSNSSVSHHSTSYRRIPAADKLRKHAPLVLVFGEDADACLLYKSFLEMWGYRVSEAGGIEEMLTLTEYLQPKLILMDCSLKIENNVEAIEKIRDNLFLHKTPLILISGHSHPRIRALALKAGADEFLVKPVNFDDLSLRLEEYVETLVPGENQKGVL